MMGPVADLADELARLPSLGRRSAGRMALYLALQGRERIPALVRHLQAVAQEVCLCNRCAGLTLKDRNPCRLCSDPHRDSSLLCVVGKPDAIDRIESSGGYNGRYFALLGRLTSVAGQKRYQARKAELLQSIRAEPPREVILAFDPDIEGDACATDIARALETAAVSVSRIAFGLPVGSGIAYADAQTLTHALAGRRRLSRPE